MPVSYKSAMGIKSAQNLTLDRAVILRGTRIICRDLSFTLPAGGRLWLRGSNGSGKSTLLRALAGFMPLTSGAICWGETKLQAGQSLSLQAHLPIWFHGHDTGLSPALTGRQNLHYRAALSGQDSTQILEDDHFAISAFLDRPVRQLSAGQTQRLALSRLTLSPPDALWLLDEPETGLDTPRRDRLFSLIDSHCQKGGRVILASHTAPPHLQNWSELDISPDSQTAGKTAGEMPA